MVDTGGLVPTESMGDSITLLDTEGNMQAYLNIGELKDAGGNCSMHNRIDIAPYEQPGKYLVMVTLDEAFRPIRTRSTRCRRRFLSNRRRQLYQRCGRQLQLALEQLCELHYPLGRLYQRREIPFIHPVYHGLFPQLDSAGQHYKFIPDLI